jgi:hypothetical protein
METVIRYAYFDLEDIHTSKKSLDWQTPVMVLEFKIISRLTGFYAHHGPLRSEMKLPKFVTPTK